MERGMDGPMELDSFMLAVLTHRVCNLKLTATILSLTTKRLNDLVLSLQNSSLVKRSGLHSFIHTFSHAWSLFPQKYYHNDIFLPPFHSPSITSLTTYGYPYACAYPYPYPYRLSASGPPISHLLPSHILFCAFAIKITIAGRGNLSSEG
jgi:hypothetical protein